MHQCAASRASGACALLLESFPHYLSSRTVAVCRKRSRCLVRPSTTDPVNGTLRLPRYPITAPPPAMCGRDFIIFIRLVGSAARCEFIQLSNCLLVRWRFFGGACRLHPGNGQEIEDAAQSRARDRRSKAETGGLRFDWSSKRTRVGLSPAQASSSALRDSSALFSAACTHSVCMPPSKEIVHCCITAS